MFISEASNKFQVNLLGLWINALVFIYFIEIFLLLNAPAHKSHLCQWAVKVMVPYFIFWIINFLQITYSTLFLLLKQLKSKCSIFEQIKRMSPWDRQGGQYLIILKFRFSHSTYKIIFHVFPHLSDLSSLNSFHR